MAQYTFLDTEGFTKGLKQFWTNVKDYYSKTSSTSPTVYYTYKSDILATPRTFSIESDDSVITAPEIEFNGSNNVVLHTTIDDAKSATELELAKHGLMSADDKHKFDKLKKINSITENIAINEELPYSRDAKLLFEESTGTLSILLPYYALKTDLNKVFKFKGVVDTIEELKAIENPEIGDVYHVSENHYDYVWVEGKPDSPKEEDRKDHWESLGPNQDMENYYTKAETDKLLSEEKTARVDEDTALNVRVDNEVSDRQKAIADLNTALIDMINAKEKALQESLAEETTSRGNADAELNSLLNKEISDRETAISNLNESLTTALANEAETRLSDDNVLRANIDTEAKTRLNADDILQDNINSEASAREQQDNALEEKLNKEIDDRKSAIEEETTTRDTNDKELQEHISAEEQARTNADNSLSNNLAKESETRANADNTLSQSLASEAETRLNEDETLQANINAETQKREEEDKALATSLANETKTRENADTSLDTKKANKIATANGNILKADVNGDLADTGITDTNLFKIDNGEVIENNNSFVTGGQVYKSISDLATDTTTNIEVLTTALNKESEDRANADNTITANLNQEILDRKSGDSTLQSNIDSLGNELRQADSDIKDNLSSEAEERKSKDEELQTAIDKEITDRQDAINALDVESTSSENDGQFVFDVSEADGKISVTRKVLEKDLTQLGETDTKIPPTAKAVKTYVDTTETTYKFTDGIDGKFTVTPYVNEKAGTAVEVNTGAINKIENVDVVSTDDKTVTLAISDRKVTIDFEEFVAKIDDTAIQSLVENGSYD